MKTIRKSFSTSAGVCSHHLNGKPGYWSGDGQTGDRPDQVEATNLRRLSNTVIDWDVDLSGPGDQMQVSANTLHVALAMPEDEAERAVAEGALP